MQKCKKEYWPSTPCNCEKCCLDPYKCDVDSAKKMPQEQQFEYLINRIDQLENRVSFLEGED